MNKELPSGIHSIQFKDPLWAILPIKGGGFVVECRNELAKSVHVYKMDADFVELEEIDVNISWQDKLLGLENSLLSIVSYPNIKDPSIVEIKSIDVHTKEVSFGDQRVVNQVEIMEPQLFEVGSAYFQTVVDFLAMELPLSCEYLEFNSHIIISYYLRSEGGFDRFLLCLLHGQKKWKIRQDDQMRGFSSGSFFVVNNRLVFVKDRNEVCFYNL